MMSLLSSGRSPAPTQDPAGGDASRPDRKLRQRSTVERVLDDDAPGDPGGPANADVTRAVDRERRLSSQQLPSHVRRHALGDPAAVHPDPWWSPHGPRVHVAANRSPRRADPGACRDPCAVTGTARTHPGRWPRGHRGAIAAALQLVEQRGVNESPRPPCRPDRRLDEASHQRRDRHDLPRVAVQSAELARRIKARQPPGDVIEERLHIRRCSRGSGHARRGSAR